MAGIGFLAAFVMLILTLVFGMMKSSEPYQTAMQLATEHPALMKALGEPIEAGYFTAGSIRYSGSKGEADLSIPVYGPNGKATVFVGARRAGEEWNCHVLAARIKGSGEKIDLLDGSPQRENN